MGSTTDHITGISSCKNKGPDIEDIRRHQADTSVEKRKKKKEEALLKRRNVNLCETEPDCLLQKHIISCLNSSDSTTVSHAMDSVIRILAEGTGTLVQFSLIKMLTSLLANNDRPELQYEAACVLANISAKISEQIQDIVRSGNKANISFQSQVISLVFDCISALWYIAKDRTDLSDLVTEKCVIEPLLRVMDMSYPLTFSVSRSLEYFFRTINSSSKIKTIQTCMPTLRVLLQDSCRNVLDHTCRALKNICNRGNNQIQEVIGTPGVLTRLLDLLGGVDSLVVSAALSTVGYIVCGNELQTQAVLDEGILKIMPQFLQHPKKKIKKDAIWLLSNITAGSAQQIQQVIDHNLLPLIIQVLCTGDVKSQTEAAWAIGNLVIEGTAEQINLVIQCGALNSLCELLVSKDTELLHVLLNGIINVLEATDKTGQAHANCEMIEKIGGLDKIKQLQNHKNVNICSKANKVIEKFFPQETQDHNLAPVNRPKS